MPTNPLISLREELPSGLFPGIHDLQVPLWKDGENIQFSETGPEGSAGFTKPFTSGLPTGKIRGMGQNVSGNVQQLYFGDQTTLRKWVLGDASASSEGTGYTGNVSHNALEPAHTWSFQEFGSWMLATNGKDYPQIDKGAGFSSLSNGSQFSTALIFKALGPNIIAINTSVNSRGYLWCDTDDVEDWIPTASNNAGDGIFREATSDPVAAEYLGESIAVYTKEEIFIISRVGGNNVFGYRKGASGVGAISQSSVIPVDRKNYAWGPQGIYETDGINYRFIDAPLRDFLKDDLEVNQKDKICGFHDEVNQSVVWFYPALNDGSSEPTKGISYNYSNGTWTRLGYGRTSCIERNNFDYALSADVTDVYYENNGLSNDGTAITKWVRTRAIDGGSLDYIKELDAIRIGFEGTGLQYRIGCQDQLDDAITWTSYANADVGVDFLNERVSGRFLTLELYSNTTSADWNVSGIDVYGRMGGTR